MEIITGRTDARGGGGEGGLGGCMDFLSLCVHDETLYSALLLHIKLHTDLSTVEENWHKLENFDTSH